MATTLQDPAHPRRVGARLDGYPHRLRLRKAPLEGPAGGGDTALLYHLTLFTIHQTEVGVAIPEVYAGGYAVGLGHGRSLLPALVHTGPTTPYTFCRRLRATPSRFGRLIPFVVRDEAVVRLHQFLPVFGLCEVEVCHPALDIEDTPNKIHP